MQNAMFISLFYALISSLYFNFMNFQTFGKNIETALSL